MSATETPLTEMALRPDGGSREGKLISVRANFFAIPQLPVDTIWHYDVAITPAIPPEKARRLWKVIEEMPEIAKYKTVFDGRCNAYASTELDFNENQGITRQVDLPDPSGPPPNASTSSSARRNAFTVKISRVAVIDLRELHRFLQRDGPLTNACMTAIQALNVVMTHKLFSEQVSVGRSAYTPNNAQDLGGGVEKWDGIFQSIRPGQTQLFANIDIASAAFIKGGNAAGLMAEIKRVRHLDELRRPNAITSRDFQTFHKHFRTCSFTVTHRGGNFKKSYKVAEVSMTPADKITFQQTLKDGSKTLMSIPQYYQQAYGLRLQFPFLPCIGVKGRESSLYFPAEVCVIQIGKRYTKRLNEEQTSNMIRGTCIRPQDRADKIIRNIRQLDISRNEYMREFGLRFENELAVVPARILPPPRIEYARKLMVNPQDGSWRLDPSKKMYIGQRLESWGILVFEDEMRFGRHLVHSFVRELTSTMSENGMNVVKREPPILYAQANKVEGNVNLMWSTIERSCNASPQLILVILPSVCQTYSAIKAYGETTTDGKMTQCVLSNKVRKVNKQYCGMLGLKINTKLGGINSTLARDSIPFVTDTPTMVIGADVTHPSAGEARPSVVAVVGSMDEHAYRYAGRLQIQDVRCEVIDRLKYLVYELVAAFVMRNGVRPKRILFYRDGVSDGQFAQVMRDEVQAVKDACRHMDPEYNPPITFCVVKKRHHARIFPMHSREADRSGNCQAGTVVDSVITHPTAFDFYLQSHGGLQGTSRPTLYHVLLDENRFSSDALQALTFRLCHVYSRCPKSVSIVPPVYYAHLLAYRARHYQSHEFSDSASTHSGGSDANYVSFQISDKLKNYMYFI
ncbi:argonaute 1 [Haplosporangium bisporale]|nr:argonaute 1 [Haplosporangium bisporale]